MKLLSFGEIIWDIFDEDACIGGAPLNFAAHAVKQGADAYLLSAVGNDELGADALKEIAHHSINGEYIYEVKHPTGYCKVTLDQNGVPRYKIGEEVAYDFIPADDLAQMTDFDVVAFGTLALRGEHNRNVLSNLLKTNDFKERYCDINIRPPFYSKENTEFCLENATILKISDEELSVVEEMVFSDASDNYITAAKRISEKFSNLKLILITLGEKGAFVLDCRSGEQFNCPASEAKVVSTVGAGDSFGAAFIVAYMNGEDLPICLKKAADLSAYVVSHTEAVPE